MLARLRPPGGTGLVVGCVHCHNARNPEVVGREIALAAAIVREAAGEGPAVLAGDLNVRPDHSALAALAADGWHGATLDAGSGIDRILSQGLRVLEGPRAMPPSEREVTVSFGGLTRRLLLSDHDPVVATLEVPPATGSAS